MEDTGDGVRIIVTGGAGRAGKTTFEGDVGVGVYVEDVRNPIAHADVDAAIVAEFEGLISAFGGLFDAATQLFVNRSRAHDRVHAKGFGVGVPLGIIRDNALVVVLEAAKVHHRQRQHEQPSVAPQGDIEFWAVNEVFDQSRLMPGIQHILHPLFELIGRVNDGFGGDAVGTMFAGGLHQGREAIPAVGIGSGEDLRERGGDSVLEQMLFGDGFVECGG